MSAACSRALFILSLAFGGGAVRFALAAAAPAPAAVAATAAAPTRLSAPTFRDVAPIIFNSCTGCHRAGEVAASMPLTSYEEIKSRAASIKEQVVHRSMPPWPADSARSLKMRNDPELSTADIDTISRWVDVGTPAGNLADVPPLPPVPPTWRHPKGLAPDAVLSLPVMRLPASGEIPYMLQRLKVPYAADKWVVAMQVLPGNYDVVHHMAITEIALAKGITPEQVDSFSEVARRLGIPPESMTFQRPAVSDPVQSDYDMLGIYTPGTTFEAYREGSARLLKSGADTYLAFNVHYTTTGKPEEGRPQLALWFQPQPPRHQLFRTPAAVDSVIANGRELLTDDPGTKAEGLPVAIPPIPPRADNYELIGMTAYAEPVTFYQLQPHAHMRGKDFKYSIVYPDGHEVTMLTVPKYDFHWQLAYDLETPLQVPAGSKLIVTAHYDNSDNNKHLQEQPSQELARNCGPDKQAYFRRENQSWDEMFSPFVQYSQDNLHPGRDGAGEPGAAPNPHSDKLPLVEVVGCLARAGKTRWELRDGSQPRETKFQSTSAAALKISAALPRAHQRYELLGLEPFTPASHVAQVVSVKGVLIGRAPGQRINITSLQALGACR